MMTTPDDYPPPDEDDPVWGDPMNEVEQLRQRVKELENSPTYAANRYSER